MKTILISRIFGNENKTLGEFKIYDNNLPVFECKNIELPWKENKRRISCIPANEYIGIAITRPSNKKYAIHIQNVPGRDAILIHQAGRANQLLGCIAPGMTFQDTNKDGIIDVTDSKDAMIAIEKLIPLGQKCRIKIVDTWRAVGNLDPKTETRI